MATHIVKVKDFFGENKFQINSLRQKVIDAAAGETIIFDQSDASNDGHRLRIALYPDGAWLGGGSEYTVGVTIEGTPGEAGAKTKFTVSNTSLHGTYFYYCESHRYMGGMIHYGSDSIPQVDGAEQPTVPAKYRLIDEGATASDAQDGDLTNNIVKTVEQKNELTTLWDYVWDETTTHSNPWAVQNTDTRNTVQYRIRYEVQDSAGVAAVSRNKFIDITAVQGDPAYEFRFQEPEVGEVVGYALHSTVTHNRDDGEDSTYQIRTVGSRWFENISSANWNATYDGLIWFPAFNWGNTVYTGFGSQYPYDTHLEFYYTFQLNGVDYLPLPPGGINNYTFSTFTYEGKTIDEVKNRAYPGVLFLKQYGWYPSWTSGKTGANIPYMASMNQTNSWIGNYDWTYGRHLSGYVSASVVGNSSVHKYKLRHKNPDDLHWFTSKPPITTYHSNDSGTQPGKNMVPDTYSNNVLYEWYRYE